MGMIIYVILSCCFCWIWLWNWLVFELSVCGLKLLCFRYLWTRFIITMWTLMYEVLANYLWNGCNMWLVMLNYYDLGCVQVGLKSFMVLVDYRVYMGSSMMVWSLRWLLLYLCSYKLVVLTWQTWSSSFWSTSSWDGEMHGQTCCVARLAWCERRVRKMWSESGVLGVDNKD